MNPWPMKVVCDVCGGEAVGSVSTAAAAWDARTTIVHLDPRACRDFLARAHREALRELEALRANPPIHWKADVS